MRNHLAQREKLAATHLPEVMPLWNYPTVRLRKERPFLNVTSTSQLSNRRLARESKEEHRAFLDEVLVSTGQIQGVGIRDDWALIRPSSRREPGCIACSRQARTKTLTHDIRSGLLELAVSDTCSRAAPQGNINGFS